MSYSDIYITHFHITEDLSVAVQSRVQAVNCFDDCVSRDIRRCCSVGIRVDCLCVCVCVGVDYFELYWSSYSKS